MKRKVLVAILQLGLSATDQWFTNRNLHGRGKMHEDNPVARPFTGNTLTLSLSSAARSGSGALRRALAAQAASRPVARGLGWRRNCRPC